MWELLTAIAIGLIVILIAGVVSKKGKPSRRTDVQATYICPSCGSRNCDCYKRTS